MIPETRSEQYLASIVGEDVGELPPPQSRIEHYLNAIAQNGIQPSSAGLITYDPDADYPDGSLGKAMKDFTVDAGDVEYDSSETYTSGTVGAELNGVKSEIEEKIPFKEKAVILKESAVSWDNSTDGRLKSDGTTDGLTGYCVTDYIPLANVQKVFRYNVSTQYYLEAYALYDAEKVMISGSYHARTTTYNKETYKGHANTTFYDISAEGAAYIRITKDKSYAYLFGMENCTGWAYDVFGEVRADNIERADRAADLIGSLNDALLAARGFVLFRSDRDPYLSNTYIDPATGGISTLDAFSSYATSDFIPVEPSHKYATGSGRSYAFYDKDKSLLSYGKLLSSDQSLNGTDRYWFITSDATAAYIRVCWVKTDDFGLQRVPDSYDVVCFGDSIFGINKACFDISTIAQEKTGYSIANCGFGGTPASDYPDSTSPYYKLSLCQLADAVYAEDFTEQVTAAETIQEADGSVLTVPRAEILTSVDFTKVKLITIAYGTNDATFNAELDDENDRLNTATYSGALRYSIEKFASKYPAIQIALISSPYGRRGTGNAQSTDEWTNSLGYHLTDYVEAMKDVAEEYHLPFFDHYSGMGINDLNWQQYLRDGTHLTFIKGANLIGARTGAEINTLLPQRP